MSSMYRVTVSMNYPWEPEIPADEEVWFVLAGEYPCNSADEARQVVLRLIGLGNDDRPGWVLDDEGVAWPFCPDTVRDVTVEEVSS